MDIKPWGNSATKPAVRLSSQASAYVNRQSEGLGGTSSLVPAGQCIFACVVLFHSIGKEQVQSLSQGHGERRESKRHTHKMSTEDIRASAAIVGPFCSINLIFAVTR